MEEEKILRSVLQDAKIGWWKADITERTFHMSDILCDLLGLRTNTLGFDEFRDRICDPYREKVGTEIETFTSQYALERSFPFIGAGGKVWMHWKMLGREIEEGRPVVVGYARKVESPDNAVAGPPKDTRLNTLLMQLNSISHTLLSLLHTDQVDEVIDKILREILTIFSGGRAYIVEFDWEKRMHICTYEVTADSVGSERDRVNSLRIDDTPWWVDRITRGLPVILSDLDELPPEAHHDREILEAQEIKSMIVMPLCSRNDKVWGYAGIDLVDRYHTWSNEDCQWFSSLINIISLCIELQRSEREAQTERAYLQSLYQHMPLGYVRLRMLYDEHGAANDYLVVDSNYASDEILRQKRETYVGRKASELGLDLAVNLPLLCSVLSTGQYLERDALAPYSDRMIHVLFYTTLADEVICLFSDTTEVHQAHQALYRNEKLLRSIYDNIPVGIEFYDKNGTLVDINKRDLEIFGIDRKEEVLGVNFFENPNVPKDIREGVRAGNDQSFRIYYPFKGIGGYYPSSKTGYLELFTTVSMINDMQGRLASFILMNMDNTEINRAHSRLAEFESSFSLVSRYGKVGYGRFDLLSREGFAMPQWFLNLGESPETPLSQVIGVYAHIDPLDRAALFESIAQVKRGEIDSFGHDLKVLHPDKETWTRVNVMRNPMNNDPSKIEMVCVNYDITELKQTEKNLIEAKNKAEVSDRLKSAFLANMSHEIRTPLNAIVGFSNLLVDTDSPEEKREYMRIVEENNDLLLKLISDILDLSKIEAGTFEFNYGPMNVNQMCREIVQSLGLKVQDKSVELRFGEHRRHCHIVSDKNRLVQVITNFINNALKFTCEGSITLGYRTTDDDSILFYVEDTGAGIPEEHRRTIFDRFVKLNSFVQGTGLGLSICKSIVEQMGGTIGVDSEVGRGSRFWFTVPVASVADTPEALLAIEESEEQYIPASEGERPHLLIAEDTDSNFLLVSLMLRKEFEISRAHNGVEAVELCRELSPALILMDIKMPEMDGMEAARRIRSNGCTVPILAMTAFAYDRDRQKALDAGCDDYMAKPIAAEALKQKIRHLLRQHAASAGTNR